MTKVVSVRFPDVASRPRELADRVTPVRQAAEMSWLWLRNGIGLREYDHLGLFRSSIPWREKRNFASTRWYLRHIDRVNPHEHRIVAWNKIVTHGVLQTFHIPTPELYGYISPYNGSDSNGRPLRRAADLERLIEERALHRACFKLVGGWSGRGFMKVEFSHEGPRPTVRILPDGAPCTVDEFWRDHLEITDAVARSMRPMAYGYLCQSEARQHPVLADLHPESINTCRIWMAQSPPGVWRMFAAVLRMGTGTVTVDNGAPGGIGAVVDVETGMLSAAVRRGRAGRSFEVYRRHPSTGRLIEGLRLPRWEGVEQFCARVCSAFPYFALLALDLVIGFDDYVILEVEADPHSTHQAHFGRGVRPLIESLIRERAKTQLR